MGQIKIDLQQDGGRNVPWWGEYVAQYQCAARYVTGARVLDMGCGQGYGTKHIFDHGAVEVIGVDTNGAAILSAQERYGRDGVSFLFSDAKKLPFADESFDAITCFQLLESSPSVDQILAEARRLLKLQGHVIITTANRYRGFELSHSPVDKSHIQEFDLDELRRILKRNFSFIDIQGLVCTRTQPARAVDFVREQIDNHVPWRLREAVVKRLFGVSYYPDETEFALTGAAVKEAPLFFAVCRP